jgi:CCR4-NOT transcriptional regulation complex NOT5 subunit
MIKLIQGKKPRDKYYLDTEKNTVSDKEGNVIKLYVDTSDINAHNLAMDIDDLFHSFYMTQNMYNDILKADKGAEYEWQR